MQGRIRNCTMVRTIPAEIKAVSSILRLRRSPPGTLRLGSSLEESTKGVTPWFVFGRVHQGRRAVVRLRGSPPACYAWVPSSESSTMREHKGVTRSGFERRQIHAKYAMPRFPKRAELALDCRCRKLYPRSIPLRSTKFGFAA